MNETISKAVIEAYKKQLAAMSEDERAKHEKAVSEIGRILTEYIRQKSIDIKKENK